jgi:uncharacterized delta-60 repeat protein
LRTLTSHVAGKVHPVQACAAESLEARRLFAAGDYDPTFGHSGLVLSTGTVVGLDERNGKTVIATRHQDPTSSDPALKAGVVSYSRYQASGLHDDDFLTSSGSEDALQRFSDAAGLVVQANNGIIVAGRLRDGSPVVWRLRPADGTLDTSFGVNGFCRTPIFGLSAPALAPDGKIVVAGSRNGKLAAARLTSTGRIDGTFGNAGVVTTDASAGEYGGDGNAAVVRPDGSVLVCGDIENEYGDPQASVVQFSPTGKSQLRLLGENPADYDIAYAMDLAPNGDLYVGISGGGGGGDTYALRLGADGSFTRFETVGSYTDQGLRLTSIHVSNDGQRLVGFGFHQGFGNPEDTGTAIMRWNADGTLDRSLGGDGVLEDYASHGDLLPDQRMVVAGNPFYLPGNALFISRRQWGSDGLSVGLKVDDYGFFRRTSLWVEGSPSADTVRITGIPATQTKPAQVRVETKQGTQASVVRYFDRADMTSIEVDGNGGNDTISIDAFGIPAILRGGAGDDRLTGSASDDSLSGDAGDDWLYARGGDDTLLGGIGNDFLDGGFGRDYIDGGVGYTYDYVEDTGINTVSYASRTKPVFVSLYDGDGLSPDEPYAGNDGEAGEHDTVLTVSIIIGGSGNDTLRGDFGNNPYFPPDHPPITLRGGAGNDSLYGGNGNDVLDGGAGLDKLFGGAGDDLFYARDGFRDELRGGAGKDRASKDAMDALFGIETFI